MTGRDVTNPLQALLAKAAATPRDTGDSARFKQRHRENGAHVILCDASQSMAESAGARSRDHHLREALRQVARPDHVMLAFSSHVTPMRTVDDLPAPSGGTALELALAKAAEFNPAATLVISDGEPTNPAACLDVARRMPGRIDVIFCGDESNRVAIEFMRELARIGAGRVVVHRWRTQAATPIAGTIRLLLEGLRQ